jgi:hypothetical protein
LLDKDAIIRADRLHDCASKRFAISAYSRDTHASHAYAASAAAIAAYSQEPGDGIDDSITKSEAYPRRDTTSGDRRSSCDAPYPRRYASEGTRSCSGGRCATKAQQTSTGS